MSKRHWYAGNLQEVKTQKLINKISSQLHFYIFNRCKILIKIKLITPKADQVLLNVIPSYSILHYSCWLTYLSPNKL